MLEGDAAAQAGVVGRAATDQHDTFDLVEVRRGEAELLELCRAVGVKPSHEGVASALGCSWISLDMKSS